MDRTRPVQGWRAAAMAVALFAITLNFLQPLAHAALMRDGAPTALWTMFCNAAAATEPDAHGTPPVSATGKHECCLGLAHATALAAPPTAFVLVAPVVTALAALQVAEQPAPVAIRDGPYRPRGPPSFV